MNASVASSCTRPMTRLAVDDHSPDIFAIVCFNERFQLALDHVAIKTLLQVCRRARPLLSSKLPRFHRWCQNAELRHPDGQMRIGLTPSDRIALALHCNVPPTADRSWLVAQADQGCPAASFFLARIIQVHLDGQQSVSRAARRSQSQQIFRHLENAAHTNHPMAQFHLAECHRNGIGVDQDHTKAAELYRCLADRGLAQAQVALGRCYETGEGVEQDYDTAIEWYSKAEDQGSEDGRLHIEFLHGWFSFTGHGVEQSDVDALNHWQEVSTKSTDPVIKPIATHMVGWMHYLGRGTQQNQQKGIKIIRENESRDFRLGEDESLASWLAFVSSLSPAACKLFQLCNLGSNRDWLYKHLKAVCLVQGFGAARDHEAAASIFEQLANDGHSDSQLWIGECYRCGWGRPKNYSRAFEWFRKSADQGNSYGEWMVGMCYYWGYGVDKDHSKEIEWYRKSAEQGNRYGQHYIGDFYERADGFLKDSEAMFWYHKAADQGFRYAIDSLMRLDSGPDP